MQMLVAGNKPQKIQKTKFRKNAESEKYSSKHKYLNNLVLKLVTIWNGLTVEMVAGL